MLNMFAVYFVYFAVLLPGYSKCDAIFFDFNANK